MRKLSLIIAVCFLAIACSVGTEKDGLTGFSISYNGFKVSDFVLVDGADQRIKSNSVAIGDKVVIVVEGVENYEFKDGRVFPGLDLIVTDQSGANIIVGSDILKKEEGYAIEDATVLRGTITVGDPMKSGQIYHAKMRIWDKIKPESEIVVEGDLVIK